MAVFDEVYERLVASDLDPRAAAVVEQAFTGVPAPGSRAAPPEARSPASAGRPAFLTRVTVTGFRGIGPTAALELAPGPGLTVVQGRNGSGKSSFAEAIEVALTGGCRRIADAPSRVLGDGWRNLHGHAPAVEVHLQVPGRGGRRIRRTWADDAPLADGSAEAIDVPGWREALAAWRPFLGYDELGRLATEGPSRVFDAIWPLLGLAELGDALDRIDEARRAVTAREKEVKGLHAAAVAAAEASDDPRAVDVRKRLRARKPDLADVAPGAALRLPGLERAPELAAALRRAVAAVAEAGEVVDRRTRSGWEVLVHALGRHVEGEPCPVCGVGTLDAAWAERARAAVASRTDAERAAIAAEANLQAALRDARALVVPAPPGAPKEWETWAAAPADPLGLADHLERHAGPLAEALADTSWEPVRAAVAAWREARAALDAQADWARALDSAKEWLAAVAADLRAQRFAPIRERALACWQTLRQGSSVALADLQLEGTGTRRRVAVSVALDGSPGAALAVMSQGELHALALSLFLPRVRLDQTPFGFVLVDDPVQSMDPHKVDGLARVLSEVATERQVIVFTHDLRLAESLRRLRLPARILRVTREPGSRVRVAEVRSPVRALLDDAEHVAKNDRIGRDLARRVVPGLCRAALETALDDRIRATRIGRGDDHHDVAEELAAVRTLTERWALALFDDRAAGRDVKPELRRRWGDLGIRVHEGVQRTHSDAFSGDPLGLYEDTLRLMRSLP